MKKLIHTIAILLATAITGTSCSDFLSAYSQDMIVAKTVYDLDEVLLGNIYIKSIKMGNGPSSGYPAGFLNILDDDINTAADYGRETMKSWGNCLAYMFGYFTWQLRVGSNHDASYFQSDDATWKDLYARINVANMVLEEIVDLPHDNNDDAAAYLRVQGETYFLRASFYFMLANLYGDAYAPATCATKPCVPLKLTPYVEHDKDKETQFERATVKEVYEQIVSDLLMAKDYLTRSPQNNSHRLHRTSAEATSLLLSRVYLYMQEWEKAEKEADVVIKSSVATLANLKDFDGPFLTRDNPEILFSQGHNSTVTDAIFRARSGDFCVTRQLYDLYDANDKRATCFFGREAMNDSITLYAKYERGDMTSHISDVFTLRLAEAYLNKAEACAMQPSKASTANALLNDFRKFRIEEYTPQTYTDAELVSQIRDERRKEFCFEGHRWFDLRRYAVCEKYPHSKAIIHIFHGCGNNGVSYTRYYRLEEKDKAYTFALPESVIKFDDVPMEDNPRETRKPITFDNEEEGGDEEDPELPEAGNQ